MDVRAASEQDLPGLAELLVRASPPGRDVEALQRRLALVLFGHPWRAADQPSLVAEDESGKLQGFLAVVPRPMVVGDRPVRAATVVRLAVHPDCRAFVGTRLLRRFLEGPQDVSLMDGGGCATRAVWERLGGSTGLVYNLAWTRPLRPAAWAVARLVPRLGSVTRAGRPIARLADALLGHVPVNPFRLPSVRGRGRLVDEEELVACMARVSGVSLRARYDPAALRWLLARSEERAGAPVVRVVVGGEGAAVVGWYVMAAAPGAVAHVIEMASRPGIADHVVCDILARAAAHGAVAVSGRVDPRFLQDLTDRGAVMHASGMQTLVHARDASLVRQVERGEALLGRLDGEWWTGL